MIPGHFKAITIWACIILGLVTYFYTESFKAVFGVEILLLGLFIADQGTHLAQPDHSEPAPTWIERLLQNQGRLVSSVVGLAISVLGLGLLIQ